MDGRAQLQTLAHAITSASQVEAAWAGTGPIVDLRKRCGLCAEEQPVRVPFLRHVCRNCAAIWVPGICVECAHTSVTFTTDGQLSRSASCGCGGALRQLALVPKPRVALDPEVAAVREVVVQRRKRQARHTTRWLLVGVALFATLGAMRLTHHTTPPPPRPAVVPPVPDAGLSPQDQGRQAGARLVAKGRSNDVFACAALVPPAVRATSATEQEQQAQRDWSSAFVTACLSG